jgi:hypothetical protein
VKVKKVFAIILGVFLVASLTYLVYKEIDNGKEKTETISENQLVNNQNLDTNINPGEATSDNQSQESSESANDTDAENNNSSIKQTDDNSKVVAYLFHSTHRCTSCNLIEDFTTKTLNEYFSSELQKKKLEFISIDVDQPQNRHYIKDYQLFTISLVIALYDGDKQEKWQNLDKVWDYLNDQEKFSQYIMTSIKSYLSESG